MLPDVDANDGGMRKQRILVGGGDNLELARALVVAEPTPAGALERGSSRVHLFLELFNRTEIALKSLLQGAVPELSAALGHGHEVLPEEGMVNVS